MKDAHVMYQINQFEKLVLREFVKNSLGNELVCPTPTQLQIIDYLLKHQGEVVLQRDLENVLGLRRATVSGVLQTMEKHGLIKRVNCEHDGRTKIIKFNNSVNAPFEKGKQKFLELDCIIREGISESEIDIFLDILNKMKNNIIKYQNERKEENDKII